MSYKELGRFDEDSPIVWVLEYVARFGTTLGIEKALGFSSSGLASPIGKLLALGYIERIGKGNYNITGKGEEFLSLHGSREPIKSLIEGFEDLSLVEKHNMNLMLLKLRGRA